MSTPLPTCFARSERRDSYSLSQHTSISPCKGPFLVLLYHIFPQILTPIPQLSALNHTYSNIYYFVYVEVLKSHIVSCYRTQTFSLLNSVLILTLYSCHSILWVHCVWMLQNISEYAFHPILCICSSGDGHLSCLQLPATTTLSVPHIYLPCSTEWLLQSAL